VPRAAPEMAHPRLRWLQGRSTGPAPWIIARKLQADEGMCVVGDARGCICPRFVLAKGCVMPVSLLPQGANAPADEAISKWSNEIARTLRVRCRYSRLAMTAAVGRAEPHRAPSRHCEEAAGLLTGFGLRFVGRRSNLEVEQRDCAEAPRPTSLLNILGYTRVVMSCGRHRARMV
jgi:hypothetical protein